MRFILKLLAGCLVTFLIPAIGCRNPLRVEKIHELRYYSSGSGIAFLNEQVYLIGDDMGYLLIADSSLNILDSIQLTDSGGTRIPKDLKHDIEAAAVIRSKKSRSLLLVGSGSLEPYRYEGWLINPRNKQKTVLGLEAFYKRIRANGIKELNIEGVAAIPGGIVLANRGNKSSPKNHLIFTTADFWNFQATADIRIMKLGVNKDSSSFSGVSGLEYSSKSDCLLLTISTENTYNTTTDGSIGKSYLWLINNISSKKRLAAINPNREYDLDSLDSRFKGYKIESVCILSENKSGYELLLAADNDNGSTMVFKVILFKDKK